MISKIRVMIVDDHPLLREALHKALSRQRDMEVVAEATDGIEAVALTSELLPDIVKPVLAILYQLDDKRCSLSVVKLNSTLFTITVNNRGAQSSLV